MIITPKYQAQLLEQLNEGHLIIIKMKAWARSYIWWPGMDQGIKKKDALPVK